MERADICYRLIWCIYGSQLRVKDAAKYLNVKPSYVSMALHPELWHRCPAKAWKRFYEWFISDCILEEFRLDKEEKILPEFSKATNKPGNPTGSKKIRGKFVHPENTPTGAPLFEEEQIKNLEHISHSVYVPDPEKETIDQKIHSSFCTVLQFIEDTLQKNAKDIICIEADSMFCVFYLQLPHIWCIAETEIQALSTLAKAIHAYHTSENKNTVLTIIR